MNVVTTEEEKVPSLADRILRSRASECDLYLLPTPVEHVVSFAGSIQTLPDFAGGEALTQDLSVLMLDKGTKRRDRFAIADLIDNRGAQLQFRSNGTRTVYSGRALRTDLDDVLKLVAEQLREPLFDRTEFEKAKARLHSDIQRSMEDTGAQATAALTRQVFSPAHPNYQYPVEAELAALAEISLEDIVSYHQTHFGAREHTLVLVGDVEQYPADALIREAFSGWHAPSALGSLDPDGIQRQADRITVPVPDKQNVDVRLGHMLPLRRDHRDYLPLYVGNFVLGGNFSARLMTVVRDRLGLTYGINAQLSGMSTEYDGYWRTAVTLSPENVDRGIDATMAEIHRLVSDGVTADEVNATQTTITGSFKVDLVTTSGLAFSILINVLRGFGPEYLDDFPRQVNAVTQDEVNDAVRRYLHPENLHVVLAGAL